MTIDKGLSIGKSAEATAPLHLHGDGIQFFSFLTSQISLENISKPKKKLNMFGNIFTLSFWQIL